MLATHIDVILYVTGGITATMFSLFLAPETYLRLVNKIESADEFTLFLARHWGFVIGLFGVLMIWAGYDPAIRTPIIASTAVGKGVLVVMILMNIKSFGKGFTHVAIFDSLCALVFFAYLAGL